MKTLGMILVWTIVLAVFEKKLRQHRWIAYWICLGVSVLGLIIPVSASDGVWYWIINDLIRRGTAATALYIIVMYASIMPRGSRLARVFMGSRRDCAIMAGFLILPHNLYFGWRYLRILIQHTRTLQATELIAACLSIAMILLLVPLTWTSFPSVRKKMDAKKWKKLQRLSYVFYAMIYIHVAVLYYPKTQMGDNLAIIDFMIYTWIFGCYAGIRIRKELIRHQLHRAAARSMIAAFSVIVCVCAFGYSGKFMKSEDIVHAELKMEEEQETGSNAESSEMWMDGIWTGSANGYEGPMKVEVTVLDGSITEIRLLESVDDEEFLAMAVSQIPDKIMENQSVEVDAVTGATYSSRGICNAVKDALQQSQK